MNKNKIIECNQMSGSGRSPDLPSRNKKYSEGYDFVTIVTNNRIKIFKYKEIARIAAKVISFYEERFDYRLIGFTIMPDHIHIICNPIKEISTIVRDIKKYIAKEAISYLPEVDRDMLLSIKMLSPKKKKHIYQFWQMDFYDFNILNEAKLNEKLKYMYENPVRKNLCNDIFDYEFSDIKKYFGSGDPKLP